MPVFKNEDNGTWYVMARYVNWKGERKQKSQERRVYFTLPAQEHKRVWLLLLIRQMWNRLKIQPYQMVGFQKMRFTSCRIYTVFGKNVFWINPSFIEYLHSLLASHQKKLAWS